LFLDLRIVKELRARFMDLRILQGLAAHARLSGIWPSIEKLKIEHEKVDLEVLRART